MQISDDEFRFPVDAFVIHYICSYTFVRLRFFFVCWWTGVYLFWFMTVNQMSHPVSLLSHLISHSPLSFGVYEVDWVDIMKFSNQEVLRRRWRVAYTECHRTSSWESEQKNSSLLWYLVTVSCILELIINYFDLTLSQISWLVVWTKDAN